jgi:hypothetical protein
MGFNQRGKRAKDQAVVRLLAQACRSISAASTTGTILRGADRLLSKSTQAADIAKILKPSEIFIVI